MSINDDSSEDLKKPQWWQFRKMKIYKQALEMEEFAEANYIASEESDTEEHSDINVKGTSPRAIVPTQDENQEEHEDELDLDFDEIEISKPNTTSQQVQQKPQIVTEQRTKQDTKEPLSDLNFDEPDIIPSIQQTSKDLTDTPAKPMISPPKPLDTVKPIVQASKIPIDSDLQEQKINVDFKKTSPSFVKQTKSEIPQDPINKELPTFETLNTAEHTKPNNDMTFNMDDMQSIFGNISSPDDIQGQKIQRAEQTIADTNNTQNTDVQKAISSQKEQQDNTKPDLNQSKLQEEQVREKIDIPQTQSTSNDGKNKKFEMHEIDIRSFILYHKKHVIAVFFALIAILVIIYINTIGINVSPNINFGNKSIKFESAESVKIKYGFGKDILVNNAKFKILSQEGITLDVECDIQVEAGLFSSFTNVFTKSAVHLQNGTITINRSINAPAVHSIIMNMIESQNSSANIFSRLNLSDMKIVIKEDQNITDNFTIVDLLLKKMPDVTLAKGILKINEHSVNVSYEYYDKQHINNSEKDQNFFFSLKSPIFEFAATGVRELYGTVSKSSSIKGEIEFSIRSVSQFVSLFERNKSITNYFLNFPQVTGKSKFEYSSSGDLMKIYDGKADILDSIATFSLDTRDASKDYKLAIDFNSFKLDQLFSYIKIMAETTMKNNRNLNNNDRSDAENISFFSVVGNGKAFHIDLTAKELIMQKATYFQDLAASIVVINNNVSLKKFEMLTTNGLIFKVFGEFINTNSSNRTGVFSFNMNGAADAYNIAQNTIEFITKMPLGKPLIDGEKINLDADLFIRGPSVILHGISLKITDVMEAYGMIQHTRRESGKTPIVYSLYDMTFANLDMSRLKTNLLSFQSGSTLFQEVVSKNNTNSEYIYHFKNAQLGLNKINDSEILIVSQDSNLEVGFNIDSSHYAIMGSIAVDIKKQQPIFMAKLILNNVLDWSILHENLKSVFANNYIFLPSLAKFGGSINVTINNSNIFGETIPNIAFGGLMVNGIWNFNETTFVSQSTDKEPLTGKINGKVDFSYNVPIFNIQASMLNAKLKEFQKILPMQKEFEGMISGGGSFSFSGLSYTEFLSSLKMKAKFILQKTKLPKLGLNFLAKNLLALHSSKLFEFDKSFIESNIETSQDTEYNIVFSIVGGNKAFTIDSCNLKTAYVAGVCAGVMNVLDGNNISLEIISKYVIPALDINKGLKDIMKLNVSHKVKYNSANTDETFTTDLSQIYQYINYRRATFGG